MKLICTTILFFVSMSLFAQWFPVNLSNAHGSAMAVTSPDSVLIVSNDYNGIVRRSDSGGAFMQAYQTSFTTEVFMDVDFPTEEIGYACGGSYYGNHTSVIIKSTDNGQTWDSLTANYFPGNTFQIIKFKDENVGLTYGGDLYKTENGGEAFTLVDQPDFHEITSIEFSPSGTAFIASKERIGSFPSDHIYRLFSTDDLGETYTLVYSDSLSEGNPVYNRAINDLFFLSDNEGYGVGGNGLFIKTKDGGNTWSSTLLVPFTKLTTVSFTSSLVGYTNIGGGIFKTTDGGDSWSPQNMTPPMIISKIIFANDSVGFALGNDGLYRTSNAGEVFLESEDKSLISNIVIYPNPTKDTLRLQYGNNLVIEKLELYDAIGKRIQSFDATSKDLNVSGIAKGEYLLTIKTTEDTITRKVTIE